LTPRSIDYRGISHLFVASSHFPPAFTQSFSVVYCEPFIEGLAAGAPLGVDGFDPVLVPSPVDGAPAPLPVEPEPLEPDVPVPDGPDGVPTPPEPDAPSLPEAPPALEPAPAPAPPLAPPAACAAPSAGARPMAATINAKKSFLMWSSLSVRPHEHAGKNRTGEIARLPRLRCGS
jgi:hypothetical protein